jgi:hypothetical protein
MFYYIFNRNWVDTRWQQHNTHFHINNTQNTENVTYITTKELNIYNNKKGYQFGECGPCPVFASYTVAFALQLRKKHGNPSVRIAARRSTSQTDSVQYKNN